MILLCAIIVLTARTHAHGQPHRKTLLHIRTRCGRDIRADAMRAISTTPRGLVSVYTPGLVGRSDGRSGGRHRRTISPVLRPKYNITVIIERARRQPDMLFLLYIFDLMPLRPAVSCLRVFARQHKTEHMCVCVCRCQFCCCTHTHTCASMCDGVLYRFYHAIECDGNI